MKRSLFLDLSLYLITDPLMAGDRSLVDIVGDAVKGGVSLVQIRDKQADARALLEQTCALKDLLDPLGIPLIVNDRVDVAAAAKVGCHVGQSDLPVSAARDILGEDAIIGLSIDDPAQTSMADPALLDYIAHGPFASTGTKTDAGSPVGEDGLASVRGQSALPLVAIGGIDAENAADAIKAGADGVSVISAIMASTDPKTASEKLRLVVDKALADRKDHAA